MKRITTIPNRLHELMQTYNITQADICQKTGIQKSAMSSYVSGRYNMGRKMLEKISNAYNVSIDWLMGYNVEITGKTNTNDRFVRYFEEISPENQAIIMMLLQGMVENENRKTSLGNIQSKEDD